MSSSETDTFPAPTLAPLTDDPLTAQEAFDRLQTDLSNFPTAVDLVVAADAPQPLGRSWAFDWSQHAFVKPQGSLGPKPTHGLETLTEWIEKALRTAAGAHPVHPAGYGFDAPAGLLIGASVGTVPPDFEARVRSCLKFHPWILDVEDFTFDFSADDEYLHYTATILLTNGQSLLLQDTKLTQSF